jgi:hypothetical protein
MHGRLHADSILRFDPYQARFIDQGASHIAGMGGPQMPGTQRLASHYARHLVSFLDTQQLAVIRGYMEGRRPLILYQGLCEEADPIPLRLPSYSSLVCSSECLKLAGRCQILLALLDQRAFAFDMDNEGQIVRLVANFKGGGATPLPLEGGAASIEQSSHAGIELGAHTEAPYQCSQTAVHGHSPAPSSLILTARWNPLQEPTRVTPLRPVIAALDAETVLALASANFEYTRSDSFMAGHGEPTAPISILQFDSEYGFAVRYNQYRFSTLPSGSRRIRAAYEKFTSAIAMASFVDGVLSAGSAMVLNNVTALHARDVVQDNRRLLIRLFGYSAGASPVAISDDPLIVRG